MSKEKQIEFERNEMSEIIASSFDHNGEKWDASDFEWAAHCLQMAGYRKQSEGEWIKRNHSCYCSICGGEHGFAFTTGSAHNYCPNCGARMKGGAE